MERHACSDVRKYGTALTGMVLLGNLAQHTGRPIEWDAEQAHDERDGGRGADPASLSPKLAVFRSGRLSSWCPGSSIDRVHRRDQWIAPTPVIPRSLSGDAPGPCEACRCPATARSFCWARPVQQAEG